MELLYLTDRIVTLAIQVLYRTLLRLRIGKQIQRFILLVIFSFQDQITHLESPRMWPVWTFLGFLALVVLISATMIFVTERLLKQLHKAFESRDRLLYKDWEDGYNAWAIVIVAGLLISFNLRSDFLDNWPIYFATILLAFDGYSAFIDRKKNERKKGRFGVTEAMRKLLDKCRSWLPKPIPTPTA